MKVGSRAGDEERRQTIFFLAERASEQTKKPTNFFES